MLDFPAFYRNFAHILILIYLDDSSFVRRIIRSDSAHYTKTADRRFSARQPNVSRGTIFLPINIFYLYLSVKHFLFQVHFPADISRETFLYLYNI